MHKTKYRKIEKTIYEEGTNDVSGKCFFCGKELDGMSYCFGCKEFVCPECDDAFTLGRHDINAHKS